MNFLSLFSGIGGFDLGLERAGMECLGQCEKSEFCQDILYQKWSEVPFWRDVKDVQPTTKIVDVLCGGFPCQDLSIAGTREGLSGERSSLFYEFARIAEGSVRPGGWILVENVPGLLSSGNGRDFGIVLSKLAESGFNDLSWRVLNSRYFGVPQSRNRVYVLGRRSEGDSTSKVLLESESGARSPSEVGREWNEHSQRNPRRSREKSVSHAVTSKWHKQSGGPAGSEYMNLVDDPKGIRRYTPEECEILQGFPKGWTAPEFLGGPGVYEKTRAGNWDWKSGVSDRKRYKALGNAATVGVIEWIGKRIMEEESSV